MIILHSAVTIPPHAQVAPRSWADLLNFPAGQAAILALVVGVTGLVTALTAWVQDEARHEKHTEEIARVERQVQQAIVNNKLPADNVIAKKTDKPVE